MDNSLTVTRGLPASGKTTWAKGLVLKDPAHTARINRDDLRAMMHDSVFIKGITEEQILAVRDASIGVLLKKGIDVICDDTNLPQHSVRDLKKLADTAGAMFFIVDMTDVDVDICLSRDFDRETPVGSKVILDMYNKYIKGKLHPLPYPEESITSEFEVESYIPDLKTPIAIMVDIDGTVAHMGNRSPYDETNVNEDTPDHIVVELVRNLYKANFKIIFCSGRTDECYKETEQWITDHVQIDDFSLFMRKSGDMRKDNIVKLELFNENIRNSYNVQFVLDDRQQVVDMWRSIGLKTLQVAPGDF